MTKKIILSEEQLSNVLSHAIGEAFEEFAPKLHASIDAAFAAGVSAGVSDANRKKARQKHSEHVVEKVKVRLAWELLAYRFERFKSTKHFAGEMIRGSVN